MANVGQAYPRKDSYREPREKKQAENDVFLSSLDYLFSPLAYFVYLAV